MQWFKTEFAKSNIISGLLAIIVWAVVCYLAIAQIEIPDVLTAAGMAVIAFFFGAKAGTQTGYSQAMRDVDRDQKGG